MKHTCTNLEWNLGQIVRDIGPLSTSPTGVGSAPIKYEQCTIKINLVVIVMPSYEINLKQIYSPVEIFNIIHSIHLNNFVI